MSPVKIGFVLLSNSRNPIPSTRIAALNIFPYLRAENLEPHIVFEPEHATETPDVSHLATTLIKEGFQIVVFQKVHGPSVETLARRLSEAGIKTVYSVCDLINTTMADATDATLVVSEYLKSQYPTSLQSKIHIVHDGIEDPEVCKTSWSDHAGSRSRPLRAVLVTSVELDRLPHLEAPPEWLAVTIVGRYAAAGQVMQRFREARWNLARQQCFHDRLAYLRFLANRRIRCLAWSQATAYESMQNADIGILPIETVPAHLPGNVPPPWKLKSENRLTMKMCVGLPVIATPIPSYEPVIKQGVNGFFAQSYADWNKCLGALRDPALRRTMGERARESVRESYSMENQARRLITVLRELVRPHARR
ncbi:glycosyltransferase family protein [Noviherbaspirillum denitrificans]|uniref:Spore protein YkvP/CgeB glycosyl transferase-like domain-containing protein n=1 Tax=Noviherbaspirillum denitrificans TaxID=1968433 RepID=A0A254TBZ5_9BURK|nr:glycosyltransferase [Noviherbaspirillum denitrificans]OWW19687.1 hypothetical protein AYR66_09425 [Noviherbaspirillum denitrificans]